MHGIAGVKLSGTSHFGLRFAPRIEAATGYSSNGSRCTLAVMQAAIVTTSWDDGHSTDLRIAELLAAHGLKGTFYVAFNHPNSPEISDDEICTLSRMGMEIGSHTMTHRLLTGRPPADVQHELSKSKKRLEDIL